jgi:hypothetical protein
MHPFCVFLKKKLHVHVGGHREIGASSPLCDQGNEWAASNIRNSACESTQSGSKLLGSSRGLFHSALYLKRSLMVLLHALLFVRLHVFWCDLAQSAVPTTKCALALSSFILIPLPCGNP